jgi:hypothetical protein
VPLYLGCFPGECNKFVTCRRTAFGRRGSPVFADIQQFSRLATLRPEEVPGIQFSIGFLLVWTTVLALALGLGKMAYRALGWQERSLPTDLGIYFLVAGYDIADSILTLLAIAGRRWILARAAVACVLLGALIWLECFMARVLREPSPDIVIMLTVAQVIYLVATLVPLRLCGYLAGNHNSRASSNSC